MIVKLSSGYIVVFKDEATQNHVEHFMDRLTAEGEWTLLGGNWSKLIRIGPGGSIYAHYDALFKVRWCCYVESGRHGNCSCKQGFSAVIPDSLIQVFATEKLIDFIGEWCSIPYE